MTVVNAKDMLLQATEGKYAVGAFNITNLIQMETVVEAAVKKKAPLIIQNSVRLGSQIIPERKFMAWYSAASFQNIS